MNKLQAIQRENLNADLPEFSVGDTVQVDIRIVEGGKERIQAFTGTVISRKGGGVSESVVLRRVAYGQGMERTIPLHSPRLAGLKVVRQGQVRRGKLYYLRGMIGKGARVRERRNRE